MFSIEQFANSKRLPTLPAVATRLLGIAQEDSPNFKEVSSVIRTDPVISGKILKTVNSALFAFSPKIESIEHAIPKLGISLIRTLVLGFHLSRHKTHQVELDHILQRHWRSSLTQAVFAEMIAEELGPKKIESATCFLAAMLQDIGILAMICEAPEDYLNHVLDRFDFPNVVTGERSHFGFCHTDVSTEIIKNWGMDIGFIEAIRRHHDQMAPNLHAKSEASKKTDRLRSILQAANLGAEILNSSRTSASTLDSNLSNWMQFLETEFGFSESQTVDLLSEVNRRVTQLSVVFDFNIGDSRTADDVVHDAKVLLQEIAIKNQLKSMASEARLEQWPKAAKKKLHPESNELFLDSMTGLFNRRYMNQHLKQSIEGCIKKRKPFALMFMDVDKFKLINDSYGHATGDRAIKHIADWLKKNIRQNDAAIRIGGDEFIVVMQSVTKKDFESAANRIASKIPPMPSSGEDINIRMSVGCVFYQPLRGDTRDINWLIDHADQAMYAAKKSGGNSALIQHFKGIEAVVV